MIKNTQRYKIRRLLQKLLVFALLIISSCSSENTYYKEHDPPVEVETKEEPRSDRGTVIAEMDKLVRSMKDRHYASDASNNDETYRDISKTRSGNPCITKGQLKASNIEKVFLENKREIETCYKTELNKIPELEGTILMKMIIGSNGQVKATAISRTSLKNDEVEWCISRIARNFKFAPPIGGPEVIVNYPLRLVLPGKVEKDMIGDKEPLISWPENARDKCDAD